MLKSAQRISGNKFEEIMKKGRVLHSPIFLVRILAENSKNHSRLAAVAAVKIAKTSVLRHLVRRRIYEAVRPLTSKISPGYLIALFAKQPALEMKPIQLRSEIEAIFVKAGLLR